MTVQSVTGNRRVLVIDDDESVQADIRKILCPHRDGALLDDLEVALFGNGASAHSRVEPFEVDAASCGEDGLALVQKAIDIERPYALAFVDMRMPDGWDGLETIRRIWAVDGDMQFIMCTAFFDRTWQEVTRSLGCTDRLLILKKPFETVEVLQCTTAMVEKWNVVCRDRARAEQLDHLIAERTAELSAANEALKSEIAVRLDAERKLHHAAMYDTLTNLPNRAQLLEHIQQCIDRTCRHPERRFSVLFLDLDNFKVINDSLGHDAGDILLVEAALRLQKSLRSIDLVCRHATTAARLGGDEFVVVLEDVSNAYDAAQVAERLQATLSEPYQIREHNVAISTSIGIAISNPSLQTPGDLLRSADTAMYRAKHAGKACHAIFDQKMHDDVIARLTLENDLRKALENDEFRLVYQPIVSLTDGRVAGFEGLLRWHPANRPMVFPDVFIPLAEEAGLINSLGRWTLQETCRTAARWNAQVPEDRQAFVAVNIACQQLLSPTFVDDLQNVLGETGLDPVRLHLEVTERTVFTAPEEVARVLASVRDLGIRVYLDDFGKGYSSLNSLYYLPLDAVKIDQTFIFHSERHRDYAAVIGAVMMLARNLRKLVVAEGVETKDQLAQILAFDCDYAQGYYFSKPFDADQASAMLLSELTGPRFARVENLTPILGANL